MKENKLIAEFMGFTNEKNIGWYDNQMLMSQNVYDNQDGNCFDELLFDESWDWLMPVVEKIENYLSENVGKVGYFDECLNSNDLDVRYQAVVEFIKQYNDEQDKA